MVNQITSDNIALTRSKRQGEGTVIITKLNPIPGENPTIELDGIEFAELVETVIGILAMAEFEDGEPNGTLGQSVSAWHSVAPRNHR